jgi:hypothetical protein
MTEHHAHLPNPIRRVAAVACAAVAAIGAIGAAAAPAGAEPAVSVADAPSSDAPPKPLLTIEEQAEDIIDRAPGKQWARIAKDVTKIKMARAAYQARASADGIAPNVLDEFDSAFGRLTAAAKAKQVEDTLQAANDVSGATVDLFSSYDIGHPVQIARLDVIGRQIGFDLAKDDRTGVQSQIENAKTQWAAIRDEISTRSSAVGQQVDGTLAALDEADASNTTGLLKAEVRVLLETIDALEQLYR